MVDMGCALHNPQIVPERDVLTIRSPVSLPQMSGKTSKAGNKYIKQDVLTFKNDSVLGTPEVAKISRVLVSYNTDKTRSISKNIEDVRMLKIFGGVNFDSVLICLRRCREIYIEMRVLPESQTLPFVLEAAEVPQNLLKARIITDHLLHRNQILRATPMAAPTFHDNRVWIRKGAKEVKLDDSCWFQPFNGHCLGSVGLKK